MIHRNTLADQIKEEYEKVKQDNNELKAWFNKYNYLNLSDIAQALGIDRSHLYRLRKRVGLIEPTEMRVCKTKEYDQSEIIVPDNWRDKSVFLELYYRYGCDRLSAATGINKFTIWKYKIAYAPKRRWVNPCNNREWCYQNYIIGDRTQAQCAIMAGVSVSTFNQWLCNHDIDRKKFRNYAVPLYIKELAKRLIEQPIVRSVKFRNGYLKVSYKSRTAEGYYYTVKKTKNYPKAYKIKPADTRVQENYDVQYVYGIDIDGVNHYPSHFRMNKNYGELGFIEKRLAFHSFLKEMIDRKWTQLSHPPYAIEDDLEKCRDIDVNRYWSKDGDLKSYGNHGSYIAPGTIIAENFFKHTYGHKIFCNKFNHARYLILKRLVKKKNDITIGTFMRFINKNPDNLTLEHFGNRIKFYKDFGSVYAILKKFNITGTMLDISPGYGYNALAAAMAGVKYQVLPDNKILNILGNGFADFVGLDYSVWDGNQVDLLFYHNYYFPSEIVMQRYYKYGKRIMIYVPNSSYSHFMSTYKPEIVIKYHKGSFGKECDFLMIW